MQRNGRLFCLFSLLSASEPQKTVMKQSSDTIIGTARKAESGNRPNDEWTPGKELQEYIESCIIPLYTGFDAAHGIPHVRTVIEQSIRLATAINGSPNYVNSDGTKTVVSVDMAYAIAAYHDTGLCKGRDVHHIESGRIIRQDVNLRKWFSAEEIETMAQAAQDHRASAKQEPRSIYGRIVAEADRTIEPVDIIRRTIQYGLDHYPELDKEGHFQRMMDHMAEKYDTGGYLRLWIPESDNAAQLDRLRAIIHDPAGIRQLFETLWAAIPQSSHIPSRK